MTEDHTPINGAENHTPINGTENHTAIKTMSDSEFKGLILEEKRVMLRGVEDQIHVENQIRKKELFSLMSPEEKKIVKDDLKKSIAKMMVYWVAHSRHDLHEDLVADKPDGRWAGLALKEAFGDDEEWRKFFHIASRVFNDKVETEIELDGGERVSGK